jgi:hypothetical protein
MIPLQSSVVSAPERIREDSNDHADEEPKERTPNLPQRETIYVGVYQLESAKKEVENS